MATEQRTVRVRETLRERELEAAELRGRAGATSIGFGYAIPFLLGLLGAGIATLAAHLTGF